MNAKPSPNGELALSLRHPSLNYYHKDTQRNRLVKGKTSRQEARRRTQRDCLGLWHHPKKMVLDTYGITLIPFLQEAYIR